MSVRAEKVKYELTGEYWKFPMVYGILDVRGKRVVDIGGSYGDTAHYFFKHGASSVTVFEPDKENTRVIKENFREELKNGRLVLYERGWKGEYLPAEVLKVDCEGCEVKISRELLLSYPQWVVGYHSTKIASEGERVKVKKAIEEAGGHYHYFDGIELVYTNVNRANRVKGR